MNRGVIVLAVASALCMGLALGFLGGVFFSHRILMHGGEGRMRIERRILLRDGGPEDAPPPPPGERPFVHLALRRLERTLDLTPAQTDAIRAEFERTSDRMDGERDSLRVRIASHLTRVRIASHLTPAQRERFDRLMRERFPRMFHGLDAHPDRAVPGREGESR